MCLSNVYLINAENERELICKNVASMSMKDGGKLVFTDLMGIPKTVQGTVERVDLIDNYILVRK